LSAVRNTAGTAALLAAVSGWVTAGMQWDSERRATDAAAAVRATEIRAEELLRAELTNAWSVHIEDVEEQRDRCLDSHDRTRERLESLLMRARNITADRATTRGLSSLGSNTAPLLEELAEIVEEAQ